MPCKPVLCKTCQYQNTEETHNCDLMDQWAIFGSDPNEPCEAYLEKGCWNCQDNHCAFQGRVEMGQECRFYKNQINSSKPTTETQP